MRLIFTIVVVSLASACKDPGVPVAFRKFKIVPDIVPVPPQCHLEARYVTGARVFRGNVLPQKKLQKAPAVKWAADPKKLYTLMMVDPDAPFASDPFFRSWMHWLVVNMPGAQVAKGEVVQAYTAPFPHPSADKGLHRYVLLAFQQRGPISGTHYSPASFNVQAFVKLHKLVQPPVAGNFFRA